VFWLLLMSEAGKGGQDDDGNVQALDEPIRHASHNYAR
jgi:hypothetical protein